jgi:polyhydroxybutyrate depolymerase
MDARINILLSLSLVFVTGCASGKGADSAQCNNAAQDGYRTIVGDSVMREYILHVPSSYDSNTKTPLILNFHGNGGCASYFPGETSDVNSIADSNNFIVAYPQGLSRAKGSR